MFGHVNNARYLEFLEEARWEWLNRYATFAFFEKYKLSFVVVSITINYKRPSVLNDVLDISVTVKTIGNKSATVHQVITRKTDGKLVAEADVTFAMVDNATGRAVELSEEMKKMLTD
jgi:thioesterase-3